MTEYLARLNHLAAEYSTNVLGALLILLIGFWLARKLAGLFSSFLGKSQIDGTLCVFATNVVRVVLYGLVLLASLNAIGVPMTSVVALLGTAGLAVALALKDSLNNVAAGLSLLILRPFRVGDYIEVGSTGGTVLELNFFHTILNTADNRRVIIPNAKAISDVITNFSLNEIRRIDLVFSVSYSADLRKAHEVLGELLAADERVLKDPEPVIAVGELNNNGVNFVVRPWVRQDLYWPVRFDLIERVKLAFDAAGVPMPTPQRDMHLYTPQGPILVQVSNEGGPASPRAAQ